MPALGKEKSRVRTIAPDEAPLPQTPSWLLNEKAGPPWPESITSTDPSEWKVITERDANIPEFASVMVRRKVAPDTPLPCWAAAGLENAARAPLIPSNIPAFWSTSRRSAFCEAGFSDDWSFIGFSLFYA